MKQWQAVAFPLSLTALMYAGSLILKFIFLVNSWKEHISLGGGLFDYIKDAIKMFPQRTMSVASNVLSWRNYVVVNVATFCLLIS